MKPEYAAWIEENCPGSQAGLCGSKSVAMQKAFPELILCRGYYSSPVDGVRGHWWLKTAEGEIVDPTVSQFAMGVSGVYEEYDQEVHGELPIGKCMNCGSEVFQSANPPSSCMCSEACAVSFDAYLQDEAKK
jgi:hypothetical protein